MGAFAEWQTRMENILIKAGKRNIVNNYVWDADGGLRSENRASPPVEHTSAATSSTRAAAASSWTPRSLAFKL